ncbi:MAG: nickel pincer cofactor biosynthesis protein LarB [Candidatus Thermoplasmatota archaeon]|nr:nickel pincer cofactor biosynthesis protein LarB [Euryarchaeota archaeon]MBU4032138.1 nickel pincer cofactor biosynthesis protein LarB [Candidatus Thermoplasmatota archaeon]MBU4072088.1 nickel pincer cofactor biosynthesis protein LarB [Candidatus Thermoplasmatota archaeon]MBU4143931.1 nickel pincer cofactor biosynthesis protein LarB [Candidatus Thermoplasmatota archaeon]MBU4592538.1 nickel pincer cofactor biosynthesis protein LarB [Candidatus Thermoplasmatota archaeon]
MAENDSVHEDPQRGKRTLIPEAVLALGKSDANLQKAIARLLEHHPVIATKVSEIQAEFLKSHFDDMMYNDQGKTAIIGGHWGRGVGKCAVVTAGTSDIPIAEEATSTLEYFGIEPVRAYDKGVAGLHRSASVVEMLNSDPRMGVIVIAGMEGALPSVIASQVSQPVIAVPTSVGYGSNYEGLSALLGMLNSCVPGISVVNIDNGFGAACVVYRAMKTFRK